MAVTVRGTDILFNDGTTQTTAAGAVSTTAVLNATAGATAGAVGSYMFATPATSGTSISFGTTYAGSSLRPTGGLYGTASGPAFTGTLPIGSAQSGTWRCMGVTGTGGGGPYSQTVYSASLFLRIS